MNAPIKQLATLQAAILGSVKSSGEPLSINDLMIRTNIVALNTTKANIWNALSTMTKQGLLKRVRIDRVAVGDPAVYAYEPGDGSHTPLQKKPQRTAALPTDVVVEVIQETGRLRLQFRGLVIEIGVVS